MNMKRYFAQMIAVIVMQLTWLMHLTGAPFGTVIIFGTFGAIGLVLHILFEIRD